jgi:hypothetical protein
MRNSPYVKRKKKIVTVNLTTNFFFDKVNLTTIEL